jgi:hypothetical protein
VRYHRNTVNAETPKPNGSDTTPRPPAGNTGQRSRLRRTLFTAGVFALLAMIYVPTPRERNVHSVGYRFIFSGEDTSIAFFQLLVNVVFAALLGAIMATIVQSTSKRAWKRMLWIALPVMAVCGLIGGFGIWTTEWQKAALSDERYADQLLRRQHDVFDQAEMETYFRKAAHNWRVALRFGEATRVENRIKELQRHPAQDWQNDPVVDLSGLLDQAPAQTPLPQTSPDASGSDFAKHAAKLREQSLLDLNPQVFAPRGSRPATEQFPWKTNIVTTVFWIGEPRSSENPKAHVKSAWDANWAANYGGVYTSDSSARRNYLPIAFIPRQNPFYCALPYNDVTHGQFKPEAPLVIPWFKHEYRGPGQSVCRDRWIAIRKGNRTCYAQWEDCGPFLTDHFQYVFGNERPKPNPNHGAGLDVSPAVHDYLGLAPIDVTDWQFVEVRDVPPGPWRSYGENNHFVIARRKMEQNSQQNDQGPNN